MASIPNVLREEGVFSFVVLLFVCSIIWAMFLSISWGANFAPRIALDDDTMHKTVIYYMLNGEDFYTAWRHAAQATGDLGDLRIYRTPLIFYPVVFLTGWAGAGFIFPLSVLCVCFAALNLILTFWTTRAITGSGWAGLAASGVQYTFFFNVIPLFQISLFAMPFLILTIYWAWTDRPWLAGGFLAMAFLIKETFAFALPAIVIFFLMKRQGRHALIILGIFLGALSIYFLHVLIAQPVSGLELLFGASLPVFISNLAGFLWFGFGALYYNVLAPATFEGYYPSNPVPAFIPIPVFYGVLILQVILVWGTFLWWTLRYIRTRQTPPKPLLVMALIMWIVPLIFTATTTVWDFPLFWMEYAIWRWFAASYVGFQLLVALSWTNLKPAIKRTLTGLASSTPIFSS